MTRLSNEEEKILAEQNRATRAALESLARQPEFRLVIRRFLEDFGFFANNGTGPATFTSNALTSAHEQGKLAAVQYLVAMICTAAPDFYITILKEELDATRRRSSRVADLADAGRDYPDSE